MQCGFRDASTTQRVHPARDKTVPRAAARQTRTIAPQLASTSALSLVSMSAAADSECHHCCTTGPMAPAFVCECRCFAVSQWRQQRHRCYRQRVQSRTHSLALSKAGRSGQARMVPERSHS